MANIFFQNDKIAHIQNKSISYVIEIADGKYPVHRYFGKKIRTYRGAGVPLYFKRGYSTEHECSEEYVSFDDFPFEYPVRGHGDYRIPALSVVQESGIEFSEPLFKSWNIIEGKPAIKGLPSTFETEEKAETLEIICEDETAGLRVRMYYSVFGDLGIIVRHQKIENTGDQTLKLKNVQSLSLELPAENYEFFSLYGTHAKEGNRNRFPLHRGIQRIESSRGSSSPQHQPFFALMSENTTEHEGELYGFHLIYSGNFVAQAEKDQFGNVRAQIGLNPDTFCWELKPGDTFETPEAVLNYSCEGLNGMSRNFHHLYENHLMPQRFKDKVRPILLNSWESMYCDVSLEKIEEQSELAKQIGIELFVLDDGWFRKENNTRTSMGDWKCNEEKLPGGIKRVAEMIHGKGMQFGLWFEPEAIGEDSQVLREHPEWAMYIPGYDRIKGRHEYLLDLSRRDVRDHVISMLESYLENGDIDYIKWDMNRPLTDVNSSELPWERKGEVSHRYVLGLYEILETITKKYPDVLIEGCSSGGARFYNLGYELDLTKCTPKEREEIALQIEEYKQEREWIRKGNLYRHEVPNENYVMWSVVSEDRKDCAVMIMQKFHNPILSHGRFRLCGLDPESDYEEKTGKAVYGGDELMQTGITVPLEKEDYHVFTFYFTKVEGQ